MSDGGTWNTIAVPLTDDSEMALRLARMLLERGTYDINAAFDAYKFWLDSNPFDCGSTISAGLRGHPNKASQGNGAMMRISPLGIFDVRHSLDTVGVWARRDVALSHPNPVCLQANALFAMAIAYAISSGCDSETLYSKIKQWAHEQEVDPALMEIIEEAAK